MNLPSIITGTITDEDLRKATEILFPGGEKIDDYIEEARIHCPICQMLKRMGYQNVSVPGTLSLHIGPATYWIDDSGGEFIQEYDEFDMSGRFPVGRQIALTKEENQP